jgi:hypothetical protein
MRFYVEDIPANMRVPIADPKLRAKIAKYVTKEMQRELDIQKRMFEHVTATWQEHHPVFVDTIVDQGDEIHGYIGVDTDTKDGQVFHWLDDGTNTRYALMTNPFIPKTTPHVLGSKAGVGKMRYVASKHSKLGQIRASKPGISARYWSDEVYNKRKQYFIRNFSNILIKYVQEEWAKMFKRK